MNEYRLFTSLYSPLLERTWMHPNTYTPLRRIIRKIASNRLPRYFEHNYFRIHEGYTEKNLIVSITSFPARIEYVYIVVYCMLYQTVKPEKIILWLSKEQFKNKSVLPPRLLNLESDVFEIRMVEGDLRSHKKYYYVCKEFPKSKIVLLDDDIIYKPTLIEDLLSEYKKQNVQVVCNYGFAIQRNQDGSLRPYKEWKQIYVQHDEEDIFFGSGGGTLFIPEDFNEVLTNIELAFKLTPTADDIWLNSIARLSKLKIHMIPHGLLLPVLIPNNKSLFSSNIVEGQNDIQLRNICSFFGVPDFFLKKNKE